MDLLNVEPVQTSKRFFPFVRLDHFLVISHFLLSLGNQINKTRYSLCRHSPTNNLTIAFLHEEEKYANIMIQVAKFIVDDMNTNCAVTASNITLTTNIIIPGDTSSTIQAMISVRQAKSIAIVGGYIMYVVLLIFFAYR